MVILGFGERDILQGVSWGRNRQDCKRMGRELDRLIEELELCFMWRTP